jgi:hypothetical protein
MTTGRVEERVHKRTAVGWYVPSLVQAAAKAANRHTASTRIACVFMLDGVAGRGYGSWQTCK